MGVQSEKIGDYFAVPFSTYKNIANQNSATVNVEPSSYDDNNYVPNVFYQFVANNSQKGCCVGYNTYFGSAIPTIRKDKTARAVQYYSTGKIYPQLWYASAALNTVIGSIAFRSYFDNSADTIPCVSWYYVGKDIYLLIYHNGTADSNIKLPNYMVGMKMEIIKQDGNIEIPMNFVSGLGLNVKITNYGFAIVKLSK
jgi:hypothetical protein